MSNIINDKIHKEKKAKDALMKSDVILVHKAGFLALCNLMLEMSKDIENYKEKLKAQEEEK